MQTTLVFAVAKLVLGGLVFAKVVPEGSFLANLQKPRGHGSVC